MKKLLLAGIAAGACASNALAADLGPYGPPPSAEPIYEPVTPQNTEHLNDSHWQGSRNYPAIAKTD